MNSSIMKHRRLLGIDGQKQFLSMMQNKISDSCPHCQFDTVTTYQEGRQLLLMLNYDLIITDIFNPPGSILAKLVASRNFPVLALSNKGTSFEELSQLNDIKIRAFFPRENINKIVPVIDKVLKDEYEPKWRRMLNQIIPSAHII